MKTIHMLLLVLCAAIFGLSAQSAHAAQVTDFSITLSDSRPSVSSNHSFNFKHNTAATIAAIRFRYCTTPSGDCAVIDGLNTSTAMLGTVTGLGGSPETNWTLNRTSFARDPRLLWMGAGAGYPINASDEVTIVITGISNHAIDDCQSGGDISTDTCYVRLTTHNSNTTVDNTTVVDEGISSYTVVTAIVVTARVDPIFTFTVSAVGAETTNNGIQTSVASTFSTLPFGNLTANTPKYAAHRLNVLTNTQGGYTVSARMATQMTGMYIQNNIDPFAATGASWSNPIAWTAPTGTTPNDNTGWIGANTTDTDVSGWSSAPSGKFGPVSNTAIEVMKATGSDNGTVGIFVTYAIEANVFQPADTYTGQLRYNALPLY